MYHLKACLSVLLTVFISGISAQNQSCSLSFDGRIPQSFTPGTFDTNSSLFTTQAAKGENLTFAQIITFPSNIPASKFDIQNKTKALSLSLSDQSIFRSSTEFEPALRRAELVLNKHNATVSGHKTWHFSLRLDPSRPLNLSFHEYQVAFHEAQDFQADFWAVKIGTPMNETYRAGLRDDGRNLWVEGYKFDMPVKRFFNVELTDNAWHNLGINLDYDANLIQVFYSQDNDALAPVSQPTYNNLSGKAPTTLGETHFGLQKRPIGATLSDFLTQGIQEFGINETLFLGGIFQDESADGCVTGAADLLQQTNASTSNGTGTGSVQSAGAGGAARPADAIAGIAMLFASLGAVVVLELL